jgi:hypothetical protein
VSLDRLNALAESTPTLVDLKPVGQGYMEDLFAAGGIGAVLREIKDLLHLDCRTVAGQTLGERLAADDPWVDRAVVRSRAEPFAPQGGLVALFGNLAPNGAILKQAAADAKLFEHEGRAVVFSDLEDLARRIDAPDLDVEPDDMLVLQNAGPIGAGMPEAGYLPIPGRLAKRGVKDMIRISDARMSGTAYGTVVLHVSPEARLAPRGGDGDRGAVQAHRPAGGDEARPRRRGDRRSAGAGTRVCTPTPCSGRHVRLRLPARREAPDSARRLARAVVAAGTRPFVRPGCTPEAERPSRPGVLKRVLEPHARVGLPASIR